MFIDRKDAGSKLASALEKYRGASPVVLAIPRGGAEVGSEVAKHLEAELSIIICRKLPFPDNPEAGFGAIAEDGTLYLDPYLSSRIPGEVIESIAGEQKREIRRRIKALRGGKKLPDIKGRVVILVDDGIAAGSTMKAAVAMCRNRKAGKVVVAAPVSGEDTAGEFGKLADDVVILEKPVLYRAVAQVYRNWYDVPDEEVIEILKKHEKT